MSLPQDRQKILIIDDDPVDRVIYKQSFEDSDPGTFVFIEGSSAREGLAKAAESNPDCILLDFKLPDMDGVSVLKQLQNGAGDIRFPVVMLTAIGNERIAVEAMKLGVMDYLAKGPATAEALPRVVRNAITAFSMRREIARQKDALEQRNQELELIQKTLVDEKERYRVLTEAIPQLVWTATAGGSIRYANQRMREFANRSAGDSWNLIDLISEEDRSRFENAWQAATAQGLPFEIEARLRRASDEASRRHLLRAVRMKSRYADANWIGAWTDIEEQKRTEEAIRQQQKMDSIGLLAGGIAHDFNNLLVGIMGGASFVVDMLGRNHPAYGMLQTVVRSSERAAHLTQQLLAYAGKGETFVEPLDIVDIARDTCELVRASMPRTVSLKWNAEGTIPKFEANPAQIQQLLMNLVINAAEAVGEKNGVVAMNLQHLRITEDCEFQGGPADPSAAGDYVEIRVEDTGCGMDEQTLSRIFDPFFTTKFTGRGLGLAAVQGIVRSLNGALTVNSVVGKGTNFRLLLPIKPAKRKVPAPPARHAESAAKILVIDDEEIVRKIVQSCLERNTYTVLVAEDGQSGLQLFSEHRDNISLVLLDLSMPGMPGARVFKALREISSTVPIAVMSGYGEREAASQVEDTTLSGFLQKPFTARSVLDAVSKILDQINSPKQQTQSSAS